MSTRTYEQAQPTTDDDGASPPPRRRRGFLLAATGVVGELLITAGVVVGLFAVWQLWWTDVVAEQAHREVVAQIPWAPPLELDDGPRIAEPQDGAPPSIDRVGHGEPFATLLVPRWGDDYEKAIHSGTDRPTVLDPLGIGHYTETEMPGEVGNFALAGHRVTFGAVFNKVEDLEFDDALVVRGPEAWYVYRLTETRVVRPHQTEVLAMVPGDPTAEPDGGRFITLTTCHPMFSIRERFIVHGELAYWAWVDDGVPIELVEGA